MKLTQRQASQREAVTLWQESKVEFEAARERELKLRLAAIAEVWDASVLTRAGTTRAELAYGAELKLEIRRSAKVDPEKLAPAMAALRRAIGAVKAKLIGARLIVWKPGASLAELGRLAPEHAKLFDGAIIIELSSPSLQLIPPPARADDPGRPVPRHGSGPAGHFDPPTRLPDPADFRPT